MKKHPAQPKHQKTQKTPTPFQKNTDQHKKPFANIKKKTPATKKKRPSKKILKKLEKEPHPKKHQQTLKNQGPMCTLRALHARGRCFLCHDFVAQRTHECGFCVGVDSELPLCMRWLGAATTHLQKASRGFEPRSLDSESRVLTVTPRGQVSSLVSVATYTLPAPCKPTKSIVIK